MNDSSAPAAAPAPSASSRPLRFLRWLAWTGFVLGWLFVVGLGIAPVFFGGGYGTTVAIVGAAIVFLFLMRWIKAGTWRRLGAGYAGLAIVLLYLAIDDSRVRRPQTLEEFAPAFPGAEKSYVVLMRYGKNHPLGKDFRFKVPDQLYRSAGAWKPKDPAWKDWLVANRADLENDWVKLEAVRSWLAELNAFERIGDLTPSEIDAEILAFAPIRTVSQHACAIASLQAIDGNGDAAVETLLPVIEVGRKLVPSSRTLVRSMVAVVLQKLGMETAEFVLNATAVSPASRARLAAALADDGEGETNARKLIGVEYAWAASVYVNQDLPDLVAIEISGESSRAWLRHAVVPITPFIFNARRTINLYGDLATELGNLAAHRDFKQLDQRSKDFFRDSTRMEFKNIGGTLLVSMAVPAFSKVVEAFWKTEDLRDTLHTRLKA